jgi:hypothetical protein
MFLASAFLRLQEEAEESNTLRLGMGSRGARRFDDDGLY